MTTVSLSLGYMIFNDYIAPPPDLSGSWKFTVVYEDTDREEFEGLQVTYQVLLFQEGLNLSGHGEKLSDRGPTQDAVDYTGDKRTNIGIRGGSLSVERWVTFLWNGGSLSRGMGGPFAVE